MRHKIIKGYVAIISMVVITDQFVFIKTKKTGGTSVEMLLQKMLTNQPADTINPREIITSRGDIIGYRLLDSVPTDQTYDDHMCLEKVAGVVGHDNIFRRHLITGVRNPWDMVVSYYTFHSTQGLPQDRITKTFTDFVNDDLYDFNAPLTSIHGEERIIGSGSGTGVSSLVVRMEYMRDDLHSIAQQLGWTIDLSYVPQANSSRHSHYRTYYTTSTKERVAQIFQHVIAEFGYKF